MMRTRRFRNERGVALLMAMFALLLITSIALAMLFSSDAETTIATNYRDKQVAVYSALSALQEARDRIQPVTGDISAPSTLPTLTNGNVIYIINPADGETIAPWDSSNKYFDTELCHENILGQTGTAGVPCTTGPGAGAWYTVKDNSTLASIWQLKDDSGNPLPLDYKWVRINLKADNNTTVPIPDAATASGKQVCWDGAHQVQKLAGYDDKCMPLLGNVTSITVTNPGSGYSGVPNVTLVGGNPTEAGTAQAEVETTATGTVGSIVLENPGTGYSSTPTVTLTGDGTGALATAVVNGAPVQSITLNSAATPACYAQGTTPYVTFTGDGVPATATAVVSGTACVYAFTVNGTCSGNEYKGKTVSITTTSGGTGSGFQGTVQFDANGVIIPSTTRVTNPGSYTAVPTGSDDIKCSNGHSTYTPTYQFVPGVHITGVTIVNGGSYLSAPTVSFTGAPYFGTATTGTTTLGVAAGTPGTLSGINLISAGTGYTTAPTVTISGGGGTGAMAHATIASTTYIKKINVISPGTGYQVAPTVSIDLPPAGGTPASATAVLGTGKYMGSVYLLTSMAETKTGARAMAQMEVGQIVDAFSFDLGGAITLGGPSPYYGTPNGTGFVVNGTDANSCGETALPAKPAIGVYDDPNNPTSPTSVATVLASLGKPDNYIGATGAPDVENVFNSFGGTPTPSGMEQYMATIEAKADQVRTGPVTDDGMLMGTEANPITDVVNGDLTIAGNPVGYGILLVRGTLTFKGDFTWKGLVLVIGEGAAIMNGGGNAQITGGVYVAQTKEGASGVVLDNFGSPSLDWTGGGGNGVQYDHCWADNLLKKIPYTPPPSPKPLRVLSVRTLSY